MFKKRGSAVVSLHAGQLIFVSRAAKVTAPWPPTCPGTEVIKRIGCVRIRAERSTTCPLADFWRETAVDIEAGDGEAGAGGLQGLGEADVGEAEYAHGPCRPRDTLVEKSAALVWPPRILYVI
jgi:hypothetical protein